MGENHLIPRGNTPKMQVTALRRGTANCLQTKGASILHRAGCRGREQPALSPRKGRYLHYRRSRASERAALSQTWTNVDGECADSTGDHPSAQLLQP